MELLKQNLRIVYRIGARRAANPADPLPCFSNNKQDFNLFSLCSCSVGYVIIRTLGSLFMLFPP